MFDLFRSRDKAMKYVISGLLGLVALSLIITMLPGYGTPSTSENLIARVGDEPLTMLQVQRAIQNRSRNGQIPPEAMQFLVPQLVDQMIAERAVAYQAARMGFEVSDDEVAQAIRSMLTQLFPDGKFDRLVYERFLSQQGLTIQQFEKDVRTNLLLLRLQNLALEGVIVTPQELEREFKRKNDKVKIEYVVYNAGDVKSEVTVSPDEIKAYYDKNRTQFMTPERRSFDLLLAEEARIGASIQTGENDLRALYGRSIERFRTPERVKARHILVKTQGKPAGEVSGLEAKANDLLKQVKAGGNFAELAKKHSEDTVSGAQGGDLGWVTRGQMVKPFEEAVFSLKPNEISGVVKTEYGFHIVQALEREQARVRPFEEVRAELETESKREAVYQRMQQGIDQARAELVRNPKQAEQIAQKYNLTFSRAENIPRGQPIGAIGANPEFEGAAFSLKQGEVTPVVQVGADKLAIAAVTSVVEPKPSELAEVESQIRERITNEKTSKLAEERIRQMRTKMQAAGSDLAAAAKSLGLEVKSTQFFGQEGAADGIGPADYVRDAFVKPAGTMLAPFNIGTQLFLARVAEKQSVDPSTMGSQREQLLTSLKRTKAQMRRELFEDGLVTELVKEGKIKKYEENIKRLVGGFQS